MTIELGNRLADLRKQHGYSQEDLADKLGVSRQAISKWERGEASPDTDNLIELAKIYDISLDELLGLKSSTDKEEEKESKSTINIHINPGKSRKKDDDDDDDDDEDEDDDDDDHIRITKDGVDVTDGKESVRISKDGIHIQKGEKDVHINGDVSINVNDDARVCHKRANRVTAIASLLTVFGTVIAYILLGTLLGLWAQAWVLFLLVPIVPSLCKAIEHRNPNIFAYPVFVAFIYLLLCCWILNFSLWHPLWVIFLTIPIYHGTIAAFRK